MNIFKKILKSEKLDAENLEIGIKSLYNKTWEDNQKVVSCNDCKCLLYKNDAQEIKVELEFALFITSNNKIYKYYCNTHKKNYEKVNNTLAELTYFKEMKVDEKGEPIGYKKIKQNE